MASATTPWPSLSRASRASASRNAVRSASSVQTVKASSNWSTASATGPAGARESALRSSASGCGPGRIATWCQRSLPGSTPAASAGSRPARRTDDLPLPDGPTIPSSGAPTSRAPSAARSRSRPKKYGASSTWKAASPLNGQTSAPLAPGAGSRLRAASSTTTSAASRCSMLRRSLRPRGGGPLLHAAQVAAPAGGALRARLHAPPRLAARPLTGQLVDEPGDAAARAHQPFRRRVLATVVGRVAGDDRVDGADVEGSQLQPVAAGAVALAE